MGHIRLGRLPRTKKWLDVIGLVSEGGSAAQVAEATIDAAETQFTRVDPAVVHTVWLLSQLPDAARAEDFASALRNLGVEVSPSPSAAELAGAVSRAVENHLTALGTPRSDIGEMARLAAAETLSRAVDSPELLLFPAPSSPEAVRDAVRAYGTEKQFGAFARDFFGRLTERVLTYYVSKELPFHVGPGQRFGTLDEQRAFQDAVALHARQAARIVQEFAGGWYSKARWEKDLSPERTERFVAYALKKMRGELRRGAI